MRTDVNTLRELSKQRLIPVTHEQVRSTHIRGGFKRRTAGSPQWMWEYARYLPSWISSGVATLIESHKSEGERGLAYSA